MEKLFVLAGKNKSSINTISSIIKEKYQDKKVLIYEATTYIKNYIKIITDWNGSEEEKQRDLLQSLGREIKDKYPNFFIDRMKEDINFLENYYDIIIITGVRLEKELNFLKNEFNAILVKVERNTDNNLTEKQKNDITETDMDNFKNYDYIIENNEDIEKLKEKVNQIMEVI